MSAGLTRRQADCLAVIKRLQTVNGVSPTYEEIRVAMGSRSKALVHQFVHGLIKRGRVRVNPHHARSIEIVDAPQYSNASLIAFRCVLEHAVPNPDGSITVTLSDRFARDISAAITSPFDGRPS